jgi:putative toxin-antitoxin system antitoxin component (TIGR02293 family)
LLHLDKIVSNAILSRNQDKWHKIAPMAARKTTPSIHRPPGFAETEQAALLPAPDGDVLHIGPPRTPTLRAPPDALSDLMHHGYSEAEIFALVIPKRTLARRRAGKELLSVEETDKALRLKRIAVQAERVFGDPAKAYRWLRKPKRALNGETPVGFLASEAGARAIENWLGRIEHGMAA